MEGKSIDIIENLVQAVSILNKTDEYLEKLNEELSECDKLDSDFRHFIENNSLDTINLQVLFKKMQKLYLTRRKIKKDISLSIYYKNNIEKLKEFKNRGFLIQGLKTVADKTDTEYKNRTLADDELQELKTKRGRGRPRKIKEEVIENV